MKAPVLSVLLLILCSSGLAQEIHYLPQVANGQGIRTSFILFNKDDRNAQVTLSFRSQDGSPLPMGLLGMGPGSSSSYSLDLASGQTRFLQSDALGSIRVGSARVSATAAVGVSAVFSLLNDDGSTQTETGVGAAGTSRSFVLAVDTRGDFNTGIAVHSLSGDSSTLEFQLFDAAGKPVGEIVRRSLEAHGQLAVFIDEPGGLFEDLGDFRGSLTLGTTEPVTALTLRQNTAGGPLTTLPVIPGDSAKTAFHLPQVANGAGIRTTFVVINLSDQPASTTFSFTGGDGTPLSLGFSNGTRGSVASLQVPGRGAFFLETDAQQEVVSGAATVVSDKA